MYGLIGYLFSFLINNNTYCKGEVFLSLKEKNKITIFSSTTKNKILDQRGHYFKKEDYLTITILNSNDSMYYVSAAYSISGNPIKGWISRKAKLAIFSRAYDKELLVYKEPTKREVISKVEPTINEMKVIDCKGDWLKIRVWKSGLLKTGWIPKESQCSNPYTTCN